LLLIGVPTAANGSCYRALIDLSMGGSRLFLMEAPNGLLLEALWELGELLEVAACELHP